jgi:hypothetical protein
MLEWLAPTIWPTQLLMLATHRREPTAFGYSLFGISLVSNIILFVLAGTLCWVVIKTSYATRWGDDRRTTHR